MIRFWDFKLSGAPPLLSCVGRPPEGCCVEWRRFIVWTFLCGAVLFAVGAAFHCLTSLVAPGLKAEYRNEALFRPLWGGWTGYFTLAHPWLFGVLFAGVFFGARAVVGSANLDGVRDGLLYGLAVFVVGSLPVYALNFASFQVSAGVIASWVFQSYCRRLGAVRSPGSG